MKQARTAKTAKLLIVLGSLLLAISIAWHLNQTIQLALFTPKVAPVKKVVQAAEKTYPLPTHITIPKVSLDLPIEETAINNGLWQVADNAASHLDISARPGEKGPIILYDHNTNDKFGPIRWLNKGETINITTADGKTHSYTISETLTVTPDKIEVFTKNPGETLILYTCDGFADLERFVVIAVPK